MPSRPARPAPTVSESRAALRTLEPVPARGPADFDQDAKFVTALGRGFEVLRAFQLRVGPLSNKDLAEVTGIPKPTVTRITHTLKQLGYLKQRERDSRFELSLATLSLGYPLLSGSRIRHVAHDFMTKLAATHDCTVMLAAREGLVMVVVDERCGHSNTTMRVDVGARIEIPRSAIGRAYLAGLEPPEREELLRELKAAYGSEWAALKERVGDALEHYRKHGFVLVESEWRRDTRSVATPVKNGGAVMVLGCGAPTFSVPRKMFEEQIGPHLVHVAHALAKFIDG
jgi:DNA-binding IclR family transcriptional regulator